MLLIFIDLLDAEPESGAFAAFMIEWDPAAVDGALFEPLRESLAFKRRFEFELS